MTRLALVFALGLFVILAINAEWMKAPGAEGVRLPNHGIEAERQRIAAHLEAVEQRLRSASVSHLTDGQRAARAAQLDVLRNYRLAGRFPHNHGVSSGRVPIFVDEHGTHCAVGYLLARAGETELVARIAGTRNTATVAELADQPGLLGWLEANGITADEAGQIQPAYDHPGQLQERDSDYLATTIGVTTASAATATWNLLANRTGNAWYLPGVAGLMSGIGSLAWGLHGTGRTSTEFHSGYNTYVTREPTDSDLVINFVAGAISAALGTRTLLLGRSAASSPVVDSAEDPRPMRLDIIPQPNGLRATLRF